ncbi:hypothetical protein CROQUDRAFT_673196 [Cronartium quercuum f. sp. fusiforme G11]|uniref:Uncharacterized protein n=1 Tax=Cronartium quercuum f. sp. fusiforme G11 TaxID=708437 RepID=A0A9P6NBE6_9BASI|nr:hypothetical protein CROQUDRAFT_673196 [Cronartium quercuum f. sp. fusiforme G11]
MDSYQQYLTPIKPSIKLITNSDQECTEIIKTKTNDRNDYLVPMDLSKSSFVSNIVSESSIIKNTFQDDISNSTSSELVESHFTLIDQKTSIPTISRRNQMTKEEVIQVSNLASEILGEDEVEKDLKRQVVRLADYAIILQESQSLSQINDLYQADLPAPSSTCVSFERSSSHVFDSTIEKNESMNSKNEIEMNDLAFVKEQLNFALSQIEIMRHELNRMQQLLGASITDYSTKAQVRSMAVNATSTPTYLANASNQSSPLDTSSSSNESSSGSLYEAEGQSDEDESSNESIGSDHPRTGSDIHSDSQVNLKIVTNNTISISDRPTSSGHMSELLAAAEILLTRRTSPTNNHRETKSHPSNQPSTVRSHVRRPTIDYSSEKPEINLTHQSSLTTNSKSDIKLLKSKSSRSFSSNSRNPLRSTSLTSLTANSSDDEDPKYSSDLSSVTSSSSKPAEFNNITSSSSISTLKDISRTNNNIKRKRSSSKILFHNNNDHHHHHQIERPDSKKFRSRYMRWNLNEDEKLILGIIKFGVNNWDSVSELISNRNKQQCKQRWLKGLKSGENLPEILKCHLPALQKVILS